MDDREDACFSSDEDAVLTGYFYGIDDLRISSIKQRILYVKLFL